MEEHQIAEIQEQQTKQEQIAEVQSVINHKQAKDFTDEEKVAIIIKAKQIGDKKAAEEFGTTYWVVKHLRKHYKPASLNESANKLFNTLNNSMNTQSTAIKKAKDFTDEEKAAIIAQTMQIGDIKTAKKFGTSRWVVRRLRMYQNVAETKSLASANDRIHDKSNNKNSVVAIGAQTKSRGDDHSEFKRLSRENEILQKRIITLAEQMNKLKNAISMLTA